MQLDLLVASPNEMVDDVRGGCVATSAAKPLIAGKAFDNTARVVDAAISKQCQRGTFRKVDPKTHAHA